MINKKKLTLIFSIISFSSLILLFQNCSKGGFKVAQGSLSTSSTSCPAKTAGTTFQKSAFSDPTKKINLTDFNSSKNYSGFQKLSKGSLVIPANTKLTVSVSQECLSQRNESQDQFLTQAIKRTKRPKKFSDLTSYTVQLENDSSFEKLEAFANNDECVKLVAPDIEIKKMALPNDPYMVNQKSLSGIDYSANYDFYFTDTKRINSDTLIAIIDDGMELTHPELKDLLWSNMAEKNGVSGVDDDNNGYIDDINGYDFASQTGNPAHKSVETDILHSHGTHVAGLITASTNNLAGISGIMAKNSKLMILNIFGTNETTSAANIDASIRYAADMGAKIINISVGGKGSSAVIEQALRYAVGKGSTIVTAAGNDGQALTATNLFSPASYASSIDGVISVGATDTSPNRLGNICDFSNYSTTYVELSAPGCDTSRGSPYGILSTIRLSKYGYLAGTSMASPVAAGAAAVLYSYVRDAYGRVLTPAEVESTLKAGSKNKPELNSYIKDGKIANLTELKTRVIASYGTKTPDPSTPQGDPCD